MRKIFVLLAALLLAGAPAFAQSNDSSQGSTISELPQQTTIQDTDWFVFDAMSQPVGSRTSKIYASDVFNYINGKSPLGAPEPANQFLGGPCSGSPVQAAFRPLCGSDLPLPGASSLGGVESIAVVSHQFLTGISTSGVPSAAQPAAADLSDGVIGTGPIMLGTSAANTMWGNWGSSSASAAAKSMPSCPDTTGNHLNYISGTGITCGTSVAALAIGQSLSGCGTSGFVLYNNAGVVGCQSAAGGGNVSNTGTPTSGQVAVWTNATTIQGVSTLGVSAGGTGAATLTGVLKGNGTSALSAATAGTDFVAPGTATTFTATQTLNGSSSAFGAVLLNAAETATVSATAATGTITYNVNSQSVLYYTTSATANWTLNVQFSAGTSLNTALATGQSVTIVFLVTNGASPFFQSAFQIDGSAVTPKWQGGSAPAAGDASSVDIYTYTIIKTGSAAYSVFASMTQFK